LSGPDEPALLAHRSAPHEGVGAQTRDDVGGNRPMCTGDYLEDDLPECLSSLNHENFVRRVKKRGRTISMSTAQDPASLLRNVLANCHHVPLQDRDRLLSSIRISYRNPEILRNISKRQYVRRSALLEMCKACPKRWRISSVDLGHVVASRFCWSSDDSISMAYDGGIDRGVWAGDRFDITSADAIEERDENGPQVKWTDVTEEVLDEIKDIWSCEYGVYGFILSFYIEITIFQMAAENNTLPTGGP
jgi:hypothetical protein